MNKSYECLQDGIRLVESEKDGLNYLTVTAPRSKGRLASRDLCAECEHQGVGQLLGDQGMLGDFGGVD